MWHASPASKSLVKVGLYLLVIYINFWLNEYYKVASMLGLIKWAKVSERIIVYDML